MSDIYFRAFQSIEDIWNWDRYIYYWELREDLSEEDRLLTVNAIKLFKIEFRKEFLKNMHGKNHPISFHVGNKAENSRTFIVWLSQWLQYFKNKDCNYNELIKQLRSLEYAKIEGIPLLEVASAYTLAGFDVVFKPEVKLIKNPDLKIINIKTSESFFIDITFLKNRDKNEEISKKYRMLFDKFHLEQPFLKFSCKQLKFIEDEEMNNILSLIKEIKTKVQREECFLIVNNEYFELAIAHKSKENELDIWCKEKNRNSDLIGLALDFDESDRIRGNKIKEKAKQVSDAGWGLIYIEVHPLYFWIKNPVEIINHLESKVNEFPKLLGVVIYSKIGNNIDKDIHIKDYHVYSKKMKFSNIQEDLIFIANNNFDVDVSEETLAQIYNAF